MATAGQILIDEKDFEKMKEFFVCRKVGQLSVKNKQQSLTAYEVVN